MASLRSVYSSAYIIPSPPLGEARKHENHLRLLETMMNTQMPFRVAGCRSLEGVFRLLTTCPGLGPFLAFQLAIDLNYSELLGFSEMDYVEPGPGAKAGIAKCFLDAGGLSDADIIRVTAEIADEEFRRIGIEPIDLWGRPLHLVDYQNLYCEIGKYARVAHPEANGKDGRARIKHRFLPVAKPLPQWYPPKWSLTPPQLAGETVRQAPR
jgi:hypothetical protein